ncbi:MAG: hypothetical protein MUC74_01550 [Ideonella sp.]|nr:hypothetical protein [Ideonella sp.]
MLSLPRTAIPFRPRATPRAFLACVLAVGLAGPGGARAQGAPIPIPMVPPGELLLIPLLLVLLPLGMRLAAPDEKTVRELERRRDWDGLAALASRRLEEHPDDLHWRELRGRAWQQAGRCDLAVPDLGAAFEHRRGVAGRDDPAAFAVGMALGVCEAMLSELVRAQRTMAEVVALAPARWEPLYQLGVLAALLGDREALGVHAASLEVLNPTRAQSLRADAVQIAVAASSRGSARPGGTREVPQTAGGAVAPPVSMADGRLSIGDRALRLPAGDWQLVRGGVASEEVRSSSFSRQIMTTPVRVLTVRMMAVRGLDGWVSDGRVSDVPAGPTLDAAVAFTANASRAHGTSHWDSQEFCAAPSASPATLAVDRFGSSFDQAECLVVRRVDPTAARASARLGPVLRAAEAAGAVLPPQAYEVHYSRYGVDWMVAATWWLPLERVAGDLVAVQWGYALAGQMRPLAERPDALAARVPRLLESRAAR